MKHVKYKHLFKVFEHIQPYINYSIPIEETLGKKTKILVIAPHQDDEAIACAGTIIKQIQNGCEVEALYCTKDTDERLEETKKAISIIGFQKAHFFQFGIRTLNNNKKFEESLNEIINKTKPDIVFLPFWFDNHPDHRAISSALIKLNKIKVNFLVYAYGVWTPIIPNCLVDISAQWEKKKEAIECYKTQIASRDYVKIAQSINGYWAEVKRHGMNYAEVFFRASIDEYISLGEKIYK